MNSVCSVESFCVLQVNWSRTAKRSKFSLRNKMADHNTKIEKLNNSNYSNWKFKMELFLIKENLWKVIKEKAPRPTVSTSSTIATNQKEIDEWNRLDDQARALIGLSVERELTHIRKATTAIQVWNNLNEYHQKSTLSNRVHLMRMICSLKTDEGGNAVEHINRMQELFTKLSDIGEETLSGRWSCAMLLSSLPRGYDTLITALETRQEAELTFALVQQKVIAEFERRMNADGCDPNEKVLKSVSKASDCFFCKKPGHIKVDCEKYRKWKAKRQSGEVEKSMHKGNKAEERDFLFTATGAKKQNGQMTVAG